MRFRGWIAMLIGLGLLAGCAKKNPPDNFYTDTGLDQQPGEQLVAPLPSAGSRLNKPKVVTETVTPAVETTTLSPELREILKMPPPQQKKVIANRLHNIVIYFDFDSYIIKPSEFPKVERMAKLIKLNPKLKFIVRIEGNTDEWGTEEYNYALGLKRAIAVQKALINLGVLPSRLVTISYGELNPVCTAHTPECWAKNRRDNFTMIEPQ